MGNTPLDTGRDWERGIRTVSVVVRIESPGLRMSPLEEERGEWGDTGADGVEVSGSPEEGEVDAGT